MSIQIKDNTIIDDDRNFVNVGIMTVGSGSSTIVIEPDSDFFVGIGVTLTGQNGNISIAGTITAQGLSIPLELG
jgi:hypothetical protein